MGEIKGWISAERDTPEQGPALASLSAMGAVGRSDASHPPAPPPRWPTSRVAAVEALWGEGFITPGGAPETLRLVKPLGLSSSVTLLLLGGGLGGAAESICSTFGAWVASFEADRDLLSICHARRGTRKRGDADRITIDAWNRVQPSFRPRSANHVVALEALRGTRPMPLLESLAAALRPKGQIVLTELVCDTMPGERDREFAAWCRLDDRLPELPNSQEVTDGLTRLGMDVRVVEDLSDRHIAQTLSGWQDAVRAMASGPRPAASTASAFVTEAELWLLRIRLMRRLGVRLLRWHAIAG